MAIYHFSGQVLGRTVKANPNGTRRPPSNAVAAAAYRSGSRLVDRTSGQVHDYSKRRGVVHEEIMVPPGAATWLENRELLWSTVEGMEKRRDAQLCREFNMALPAEMDFEQRLELVRDFVRKQFVQRGMVADIALHDPVPELGQSRLNFHAHVMLTLRKATPDGLHPVKTREWNSKELLNVWRAEWALACNTALERTGKRGRVDHRTLEAQRDYALQLGDMVRAAMLNREPEIHVGPRARQMVKRGREPVSKVREVNAYRRDEEGKPPVRRVRDYPVRDKGTRQKWLERVLTGNNDRLRHDLKNIDRKFARLNLKLDFWERRLSFYLEGAIRGPEFRFQRWKKAEAERQRQEEARRKVVHARRRIEQLKTLVRLVESLSVGLGRSREAGLVRSREVEGWLRASRGREPGGRTRRN